MDRHGEPVPIRQANVFPEVDPIFWFALGLCILGFILVLVIDRVAGANRVGTAAESLA